MAWFGGAAYNGAYDGFASAATYFTPANANANYGSRLYFLKMYFGQQPCLLAKNNIVNKSAGRETEGSNEGKQINEKIW